MFQRRRQHSDDAKSCRGARLLLRVFRSMQPRAMRHGESCRMFRRTSKGGCSQIRTLGSVVSDRGCHVHPRDPSKLSVRQASAACKRSRRFRNGVAEAFPHLRWKLSKISRLLFLCDRHSRPSPVARLDPAVRKARSLPSMVRPERFAVARALGSTHRRQTMVRRGSAPRGRREDRSQAPPPGLTAGRPRETRDAPRERPDERIRL